MPIEKLRWALAANGIAAPQSSVSDKRASVAMILDEQQHSGWVELLHRLNALYEGVYDLQADSSHSDVYTLVMRPVGGSVQTSIRLLVEAVMLGEHLPTDVQGYKTFDVKVGVSCNNNCLHCVIKPIIFDLKRSNPGAFILDSGTGMHCREDPTYDQIIAILQEANDVRMFVITGGEPTLRSDFLDIIKWLYYNRPYSTVALQTNGRNLADRRLVQALRRYSRRMCFVVAIHGTERTHNQIVNNRKETGNPYQETITGIRNILQYFGPREIRSEIVLSKANLADIMASVEEQYDLGIRRIGVSYPHLDGFAPGYIDRIAPAMVSDVLPLLRQLNDFALRHPDVEVRIEEVPMCVFAMLEAPIMLRAFEWQCRPNVAVTYFGKFEDHNFDKHWKEDHSKFAVCSECVLNHCCVGVWKETRKKNEPGIKPITELTPAMAAFVGESQC